MLTYQNAGVNVAAGEETVDRIKPLVRSTFTPGVMTDIGLFGACFDARFPGYDHPILVSSTDGVGTKLKLAFMSHTHHTVGHCLVNHCVNDILACGAKPLYFLDYFATGVLNPDVAEKVITGLVNGCLENSCSLIGGETAEMPSMYQEGEYDIAGTIVGVVDKKNILNGSRVQIGDVLIGLPSSGLHTNGYSLARAALFPKYSHDMYSDELGKTLGEALLAIHRSYLRQCLPLIENHTAHALSHITGGGIIGNTKRVLREGMGLNIDWNAWTVPPIFSMIQQAGNVPIDSMREAFNLGIGMIIVCDKNDADTVLHALHHENPIIMGEIIAQ